MRLTILGATGPTGGNVVSQALDAGHEVTVLVRSPERLPPSARDRVDVIVGDATRTDDLRRALNGREAMISALGPGRHLKSDIASRSVGALIPAAESAVTRRVVVLSTLVSGITATYASAVPRVFGRLLFGSVFADKAVADAMLRASGLDWTLVRPAILTNGPHTGSFRAVDVPDRKVGDRISRADVADFMLRAVADDAWIHRDAILLTH